jgi:hypothetical protein
MATAATKPQVIELPDRTSGLEMVDADIRRYWGAKCVRDEQVGVTEVERRLRGREETDDVCAVC